MHSTSTVIRKKNETVERYKFFSHFQNPGKLLEKFITDLKLLATACNFGDLKDSLVRDRIICGIQDKQLHEKPPQRSMC